MSTSIAVGFLFLPDRGRAARALLSALAQRATEGEWSLVCARDPSREDLVETSGIGPRSLLAALRAAEHEPAFQATLALPALGDLPVSVEVYETADQIDVVASFEEEDLFARVGEEEVARQLLSLAAALVTTFEPGLGYIGRGASAGDIAPATLADVAPAALGVFEFALWPAAEHRFDGGEMYRLGAVTVRAAGRSLTSEAVAGVIPRELERL